MANTYSQIYLQIVFAVQNRASLIASTWEGELYKYICGIVEKNQHKMLAINGTANHLHIFIGYNPAQSLPDLLKDVKRSSSLWINSKKYAGGKFNWQVGYGAFSYSRSHIDKVVKYIANQKVHHNTIAFKDEYVRFLESFNIAYDVKYILEDVYE
jgi:putative transposase